MTSFGFITVETLISTTDKYGKKQTNFLCAMVHFDAGSGNCNICGSAEPLCSVTRELVTRSEIYICVCGSPDFYCSFLKLSCYIQAVYEPTKP